MWLGGGAVRGNIEIRKFFVKICIKIRVDIVIWISGEMCGVGRDRIVCFDRVFVLYISRVLSFVFYVLVIFVCFGEYFKVLENFIFVL